MFYIAGLYKFKKISNIKKNKKILQFFFIKKNIKGTIILSKEGINGTISSSRKNLNLALKKCPKSFDIVNYSLDGVIESIENKSKKIYACMWHPEREKKFNKRDIFKFKSFFLKWEQLF